jgi:hypothetical protein
MVATRVAGVAGAVLLGALTACSDASSVSSQTGGAGSTSAQAAELINMPPIIGMIERAPFETHYRGIRHVLLHQEGAPLEYREQVGADGRGKFLIETIEILSPHQDPDTLLLWLDLRQSFNYRYRDFRIRDLVQFRHNYTTAVLPLTQVAGEDCVQLRFEATTPHAASYYIVAVHEENGLVLKWQEYSLQNGQLLGEMYFETIGFDADLSDLQLREEYAFPFEPLDLDLPEAGFELLRPSLPPAGYRLVAIEMLSSPDVWVSNIYTDGIEMAFLLHQEPILSNYEGGASVGTVTTMPFGPWNIVHGEVQGFPVILAGKVHEQDLYSMLNSALAQ